MSRFVGAAALSLDVEGLRDSTNQRIRLKGSDGSATIISVGGTSTT